MNMKKIRSVMLGATIGLLAGIISVSFANNFPGDTEIYTSADSGGTNIPKVILNLDVRPNVGSTVCNGENSCRAFLGNELYEELDPNTRSRLADNQALNLQELFVVVLRRVMQVLIDRGFQLEVGVMVNHRHTNNCSPGNSGCSNGAYVMEGLKPLTEAHAENIKNKLQFIINKGVGNKNNNPLFDDDFNASAHSFQGKELYFEMFRYLTGQGIYNGHLGWSSFDKNATSGNNTNLDVDWPTISWDTSVENGANYISPLDPDEPCSKIYAINVLHQVSQQEDGSDSAIAASKASGGTGAPRQTFPNMIQFMHDADLGSPEFNNADIDGQQGVISYFLSQHVNTTTNSYAQAGGTGSARDIDVPPEQLIEDLTNIFLEILSVSTTFVAASIPVNAFNRATVIDNVFFALFQAEEGPVWPGNIKRLRLRGQNLVDTSDTNAIGADGRIRFDALTFWTDPNGADVQAFDVDAGEFQGKDGRSVDRGGAGQQIPGFLGGGPGDNNGVGNRIMYYEPASYTNGVATALPAFNADNPTAAELETDLGAANSTEALTLIKWLRGQDLDDLDNDNSTTDARPWILADSLHSRPVPVNYGKRGTYTVENPDIRILMGTNDGFIHLFRNSVTGSVPTPDGSETWAFAPRETLGNAKVLRLNQTNVPHPYGVDGAPTVWTQDNNLNGTIDPGEKVYAYFGLRRGGTSYYALDISDPDDPRILWSAKKSGNTSELGLTFAQPKITQVRYGADPVPVVAIGGGYNPNKDLRPGPGTDDTDVNLGAGNGGGNAVYLLNANNGSLVWKAVFAQSPAAPTSTVYQHNQLKDSVPADVTAIDTNGNGVMDRFYFVDTGGRVWRADTPESGNDDRVKWSINLLADLGRHDTNDGPNDRRFHHGIDVVQAIDGAGVYYAVIVGSGDRPNPREDVDDNKLFVIKDRKNYDASTGSLIDAADLPYEIDDLGDITDNCLQIETCGNNPPDLVNGWYLTLEEPGEKVLSRPLTISGTIFFSTYLPFTGEGGNQCLPSEGGGRAYAINLSDGGASFNFDTSNDGDQNVDHKGRGKTDRYMTLPTPGIPPDPIFVPPTPPVPGDPPSGPCRILVGTQFLPCDLGSSKTFWYQMEDPNTPN